VKALEYSRYDINRYHFQTVKLEASHPLATAANNGVVTTGEYATGHVTDYCSILQNIIEFTFGGAKELRIVFFQCDWFDPINDIRVEDFVIVEVKYELHYLGSNLLLAHQAQQVYYQSYSHPSLKNWRVVYKLNPKMHTHRYDEYIERHEDDDIYLEEIKEHQNFMVSDDTGLVELATYNIKLLDEEASPSNKHLQKLKRLLEKYEQLDTLVTEADFDADNFGYINY
jgi:hypothetical protein